MASSTVRHRVPVNLLTIARRHRARRPEYWLYIAALVAALSLVGANASLGDGGGHQHGLEPASESITSPWDLRAVLATWGDWNVMVLAMMLPIAAPYARRISFKSLWCRRQRAISHFLLGYLTVWAAIGGVLTLLLARLDHSQRWSATVVGLLVAAGWHVSSPRRRVLRRCGTLPPSAIRGWRAERDCAVTGIRVGLRCVFTCGPVMLVMAVSHNAILMLSLLVLLLSERRRGPNPHHRAGRELEAWCLVVCAAAFAAVPLA